MEETGSQSDPIESAVERVRAGDLSSYRAVVDHHLSNVRNFVAARSLPGVDVDEVVQRVFVEAYQSIGDYRPGTNFRAWILTIARYQLMMETTRLRRLADYHARYVPVALARQMDQRLQEESSEDERLEHLRDCLERLPKRAREVIRQRYESGLSIDEVATQLERSSGGVRKQLCLLRKELHDCVRRKLDGPVRPEGLSHG